MTTYYTHVKHVREDTPKSSWAENLVIFPRENMFFLNMYMLCVIPYYVVSYITQEKSELC